MVNLVKPLVTPQNWCLCEVVVVRGGGEGRGKSRMIFRFFLKHLFDKFSYKENYKENVGVGPFTQF